MKNPIEVSQRGLRVQGDAHDDVALNLSVGGKSLAQRIAAETVKKVKDCRSVAKKDSRQLASDCSSSHRA